MEEARQLHLRGALDVAWTEQVDGREHLVVPCIALMQGVIHAVNAETPEFVSEETLREAAESWNGKPVTLGHPVRNGKQCSANDPEVLNAHGIGVLRNSKMNGTKLIMEALIDPDKLRKLEQHELEKDLRAGKSIEVSVGALVATDAKEGSWLGKKFKAAWRRTLGDHLALLPGGRGACSMEMGCGTHRAAMHLVTAEGMEFRALWPDKDGHDDHGRGPGDGGKRHDGFDRSGKPVKMSVPGDDDEAATDEAAADDWAESFANEKGSAIDIWMGSPNKVELHNIVKAGGKVKSISKDFSSSSHGQDKDVVSAWKDRQEARMKKSGFELFDWEDNYDSTELIFTKKGGKIKGLQAKSGECETCGGTGQVKKKSGGQEDCPTCEGKGKMRVYEGKLAIKHEGGRWTLYSTDGLRRLGSHGTEQEAKEQRSAIEARLAEKKTTDNAGCKCGGH